MNEMGERQPTSPEQGPLPRSIPIGEVLAAFQYSHESDRRPDESVEDDLWGLNDLFCQGFSSAQWMNVYGLAKLRADSGDADDFWKEPKVVMLADELKVEASERYVEDIAGLAAYSDSFLNQRSQLVLFGDDGLHLVGIDAEFVAYDEEHPPSKSPVSLVAYTEDGEAHTVVIPTSLFIDSTQLTHNETEIVSHYFHDFYPSLFPESTAILEGNEEET